ncbi:YcgN family cysteine cluster protein [Arenicella sp. 4NH20-0111]|uniref:YcgN family cysteine cluster protein n=1 Tax=Arenicella sp. 4NH20-0111 TaxID=3127648 RepID=UPI003108DE06
MKDSIPPKVPTKFWEQKTLFEMTRDEWESICDGCAKCCLTQLQDEATEQLVFTNVACDLLNDNTCMCTDYDNRSDRVPSCVTMDAGNVEQAAEFAPPSCAYRLLLLGESLPDWHHLVSGEKSRIHDQGKSVQAKVIFQRDIEDEEIEDYVVEWP